MGFDMKVLTSILEENMFDIIDKKITRYLRRNVQLYIRNFTDEYKSYVIKKYFNNDIIIKCNSKLIMKDIYSKILSALKIDYDLNDINNIEYITTNINNHNKKIVFDDFQLLNIDVQKKLAYDIKIFWDYNCKVIIFENSKKYNNLLYINPDLSGRIEEIIM